MSPSVDLAPCRLIADHDDLDGDVVALTHPRRGDIAGRWRHVDVDELDDEPDDLRLLARLRDLEDLELPAS
jgi:hypothetical protein